MVKVLSECPEEKIIPGTSKEIGQDDVSRIVESVSSSYGIEKSTAYLAMAEMIRRGGHAAAVPPTFSVEVMDPGVGIVPVYKRDVVRFIELHTRGRRTFRKLAQTLGISIVRAGLSRLDKNPESTPLAGDLARTVNNRLVARKERELTPTEMVGCAS